MPQPKTPGPIVLAILDGWGIAPPGDTNPISQTKLPIFDRLFAEGKATQLCAHGECVGLPKDQDGNSEAGHLNLGAGRIVKQDSIVISDSIKDGTFFRNPAFWEAILHVKRHKSRLHLMGMLSNGQSAHSTPEHLYRLLELLDRERVSPVFIHLFTDGRDSDPCSGKELLTKLLEKFKPHQEIATVIGRFYAMDRKKEWSRTEAAYNAIVLGKGKCASDPLEPFTESYAAGITDEFIEPHVICRKGLPIGRVGDRDSIIFFNHRSDRARQLAKPFVQKNFVGQNPGAFEPAESRDGLRFVAMTDFGPDLGDVLTAFPTVPIKESLPFALSDKRQLYLAESEKYAHITYFFNGGYSQPVNGEDRLMVRSPSVERYEKTPGMSSARLSVIVSESLSENKHDFIAVNFAALDMIAHSGNLDAAKAALLAVDKALSEIMAEAAKRNGALLVTADHGNIEEMKILAEGGRNTAHSKNPVPFLAWAPSLPLPPLRPKGILADVAPTILELFGIDKPAVMTGKSLFIKR